MFKDKISLVVREEIAEFLSQFMEKTYIPESLPVKFKDLADVIVNRILEDLEDKVEEIDNHICEVENASSEIKDILKGLKKKDSNENE